MSTVNFILAKRGGQIYKNPITDVKLSDLMARDKRYQVLEDSITTVAEVTFQMVVVSKSVGHAEWEHFKALEAGTQSNTKAVTKAKPGKIGREPKALGQAKVESVPKAPSVPTQSGNVDKDIQRAEAYVAYLKALKAIG